MRVVVTKIEWMALNSIFCDKRNFENGASTTDRELEIVLSVPTAFPAGRGSSDVVQHSGFESLQLKRIILPVFARFLAGVLIGNFTVWQIYCVLLQLF